MSWNKRPGAQALRDGGPNLALKPHWAEWGFLLGAFVYLYLLLFIVPSTPLVDLGGDDLLYLANARRLSEGEVFYRDFTHFTFPGTETVYVGLFKVVGPRPGIGNVMLLVLGMGLTWLMLDISRQLIRSWFSFLPALLFLTLVFRWTLDATHHWYSVLAVMGAVAVALRNRTSARLAAVGGLCGLAAWFTHVRGLMAVLGIAIFLVWEWQQKKLGRNWLFKRLASLSAAFLAVLVILNAYFIWRAGLGRFLNSTIVFVLKYYRADSSANSWQVYLGGLPQIGSLSGWVPWLAGLLIYAMVPYVYVLFQLRYRHASGTRPEQPWDGLMLLQAVGLCLFVGVAPAPDLWRLRTVALPAVILFVWLLNSWGRVGRAMLTTLAAGALALSIAIPLKVQTRAWTYLDLPTGRVALRDPSRSKIFQWIIDHTQPGEFFFNTAGTEAFQYLGGRRSPGPVSALSVSDYTRPEWVRELVAGIERHRVRFVVWSSDTDIPCEAGPAGDHLEPLRAYLRRHYRVVKTFEGLEQVWERDDSVVR